MPLRHSLLALLASISLFIPRLDGAPAGTPGETVWLARKGVASLPVCVGERASDRTRAAAKDLAAYLGKLSGGTFEVKTGTTGIVLGMPGDFQQPPVPTDFDPSDPCRREEYLLRSDGSSLFLIGATETANERAVWDLLRRLGYRHFFPGEIWEVFPHTPDLQIGVDERGQPDIHDRRLHYLVFNRDRTADEDHSRWALHNRVGAALKIASHHAYQGFHAPRKAEFEAHPDYLPLIKGVRTYWVNTFKPCLSNEECRRLLVGIALDYFKEQPTAESISMEPSDMKNWCQCAACAARSPSDWATLLANEVAVAINAPEANPPGTRYVGLLAYNAHDAPPTLRIDPRVMVTVTSHYHDNPISREETIEGWRRQGAVLLGYDHNAGGEGAVRDLPEARREIVRLHRDHRLFRWSTAGGVQWGYFGLGAYCAAQALWDVDEAERYDALLADFYSKAFGKAAAPMEAYFRSFNRMKEDDPEPPVIDAAVIGRMFKRLDEAFRLVADDPGAQARVGEWVWFTCHLDYQSRIPTITESWKKVGALDDQTRLAYWAQRSRLFLLPEHLRAQKEWLPIKDVDGLPGKPADDTAEFADDLIALASTPSAPTRNAYLKRVIEQGLRNYGMDSKDR
jgi:hypothetical protein